MKKLTACFVLIFALLVKDASAIKPKKMEGLLKAGLLMAGLMPHPMPVPIPIPVPIRIERQHHHQAQHCSAHPMHIHTEFIPFAVETKVRKSHRKTNWSQATGGRNNNRPFNRPFN